MTPLARSLAALADLAQRPGFGADSGGAAGGSFQPALVHRGPGDTEAGTAAAGTAAAGTAEADHRVWAHAGAVALRTYGVTDSVFPVEVVARRRLPEDVATTPAASDAQRWTPAGGVPVLWRSRQDHFAPLFDAAIASASGAPAVVSAPALVALLLQSRSHERTLLQLLMTGEIDFDAARAFTRTHLGPYALDDLESVMQEAEWRFMRRRYAEGGDLH